MKHSPDAHTMGAPGEPSFEQEFRRAWADLGQPELEDVLLERLAVHRNQLERWRHFTALISAEEPAELVRRHYVESLAVVSLVPDPPKALVDLGSGQGFPGLVLAALWADRRAVLVEPRAKKAAFLRQAAHAMALERVQVVEQRFEPGSAHRWWPEGADLVTIRALKLAPSHWLWLRDTLADRGSILRWDTPSQEDPAGWSRRESLAFPGAHRRGLSLYR